MKTLVLGAALFLALVMSCSSGDSTATVTTSNTSSPVSSKTSTPSANASSPTPVTAATEAGAHAMGDAVLTDLGTQVTIYSFDSPVIPRDQSILPGAGKIFAVAGAGVCPASNPVGGVTPVGAASLTLQMPDGSAIASSSSDAIQPALAAVNLTASQCTRGFVTFEVPSGAKPAYVVFNSTLSGAIIKWAIP